MLICLWESQCGVRFPVFQYVLLYDCRFYIFINEQHYHKALWLCLVCVSVTEVSFSKLKESWQIQIISNNLFFSFFLNPKWLCVRILLCVLHLKHPCSAFPPMSFFSSELMPAAKIAALFERDLKACRWHICVRKQLWSLGSIHKHKRSADGTIYINSDIKGCNNVPRVSCCVCQQVSRDLKLICPHRLWYSWAGREERTGDCVMFFYQLHKHSGTNKVSFLCRFLPLWLD